MNKKKQDTIMVTIDSSTKKTGMCVWKNGIYEKHYLIDCDTKALKRMDDRLPIMCNGILDVLNEWAPDIIYIEEEVVTRNMDTCRFLFRLQGVVYGWALKNNCFFDTVRPTSWRKACGIKQGRNIGREELKEQSVAFVKNEYGLDVNDDEADAIGVGHYVLSLFSEKK